MKRKFTILTAAFALLAFLALPMGMRGQTTTLVSGSGTSGYAVPDGWTTSGTVEGGSYLKFDNGTMTSPEFAPHNGLSFTYSVATFGSGTNHPLTIRILNASTDAVISEMTTATPTSSTYINTGSPLSLGDVTVAFKIQMYAPTGKGIRLRNYSVTGTPAGGQQLTASDLALVDAPVELEFDLYDNANAQTISYTTSSTGAVTVSQSNYITTTVNTNNTITVTPVAVTNGPQTITVNQAADNTYAAGSVTFTVDIEDSTPSAGTNVTFLAGTDLGSTSSNNSPDEMEKSGVTVYSTDAAFATAQYRLYQNSVTTISVESGTITNIVFNGQSTSYPVSRLSLNGNNGSYTVNNNVGTWTGNADEISFSASSGQARLSSIVVTVETSGTPDPTISASNVDIAYSATSGSITYTINNEPSPAGTLTAAVTEGNWLTLGQGTTSPIAFTCTANENTTARAATVTLTYTYNTDQTISATVTVTQAAAPVIYSTIPALFAAATSTETNVLVTFNNWVVSGVSTNGKSVFVTDNNGNGFVIFDNNGGLGNTYTVGDILAGTAVSCNLKKYNGYAELLNVDANDLTITTGGTVTVANVAMADLAGVNTGALLHYDNLTCSVNSNKYYLSDGTTTIQVYNALYAFDALEDGKIYNITGIYQQYNSTKEILPRSANDIEEVAMASVTVTPDTINAPAEGAVGSLALTYENITEFISFDYYFCDSTGVILEEDPDWIYAEINEENDVYSLDYLIDPNNGAARTAYMKVYTYDDELEEVYFIVTVNQAAAPQQYTLTVQPFENLELITFVNDEMIMEGDSTIYVMEGDTIMLSIVADPGYVMETLMVNSVNHVNDIASDFTYTFYMPAENVTISATAVEDVAPVGGNYVRITSLDQLTDGSKVIIAARYDEELTHGYYAMENTTSGKPTGVQFTSETSGNDEILPATITASEDTYYWTVNVTNDGYTFTNADNYLIGYTSGTNFATSGNNTTWTITRETAESTAMVGGYTGFVIRNGNTNTRAFAYNGNAAFGAYSTSNMNAGGYNFFLDFFVQSENITPVTDTCIKHITGYGTSAGGYYLIATPFDNVSPTDVTNMIGAHYDLFAFDQNAQDGMEWRNYKQGAFSVLESGKGYLYANKETVDLVFTGTPVEGTTFNVTLDRNENAQWVGYNLVGNPFTDIAYIQDNRPFYTMNAAGTQIVPATSNSIERMEGVFVLAATDQETMTFTTVMPEQPAQLALNLNDNNTLIDRAIIRLGESRQLPKFQFNTNSTKLYIVEDGEEFAVVSSINENTTPVSFCAAENGTYTLNVAVENVEMEYLHLIDNLTGADIDLLATPSYSFEANTTDNTNRFALVYATYDGIQESNATNFAYFNGSEWSINIKGEATLQVIDMTGRVLCNEQINDSYNKSLNLNSGVYVLRLINGNAVKIQKIVVD